MSPEPQLVLAALAVEACVGYPRALYARVSHPVVWMGQLINSLERRWNRTTRSDRTRRTLGVTTIVIVAGGAALVGVVLQAGAQRIAVGQVIVILVATTGLAQHSLYMHVRDVVVPLGSCDLAAARTAVGRIVGRDTAELTESGVAAAALESLAESFNDGIVAPAFWFLLGGLPGLFAYKAINTADSLIGHREERWRMFGWAAALTDDLANLVPARIAGVLLALGAGRGFRVMWRDASKHASPNAGWPEAAMAGALAVRLGGPASYDGVVHDKAAFGDDPVPGVNDLSRGLHLYMKACALLWMLVALAWLAREGVEHL